MAIKVKKTSEYKPNQQSTKKVKVKSAAEYEVNKQVSMQQALGFDTFESDINALNKTINKVNNGWQTQETMKNTLSSVKSMYDRIGKYAGGGSIVPITGFANSVVSPAMEFKTEGYVYGMAAKMFQVAGPIIVFGIASSVLVGLIYFVGYRIF